MNDRRYKRYDFPIDFLLTCISLNMKFSIPTKNLLSFSHFLAFFINHLVWRTKNVGLFGQVTVQSQNCVTGVVERSLSQSQILNDFVSDVSPTALQFVVNQGLSRLSEWFDANYLLRNNAKTQALPIGPCKYDFD